MELPEGNSLVYQRPRGARSSRRPHAVQFRRHARRSGGKVYIAERCISTAAAAS